MEYSSFDTRKYPILGVQDGYKEWSNTYEQTVQDEMDLRLLSRITSVNWREITRAIDFACGTGRIGVWLKKQEVGEVHGIDITAEMLSKAAEKNVYTSLLNADILNNGIQDITYDLCIQVLADEHMADISLLYSEASRVIKDGGYFVIVGYHPFFLMNGTITHFHKQDGNPLAIESYVHLFSDHVKAAFSCNLILLQMEEGIVDEDWLRKKPKWEKYRDWPVSFLMVWKKIIAESIR
jgi:ubiquinone/menaquinone biosynthesis C-methylase UbiE